MQNFESPEMPPIQSTPSSPASQSSSDVHVVSVQGKEITLVGTIHVSRRHSHLSARKCVAVWIRLIDSNLPGIVDVGVTATIHAARLDEVAGAPANLIHFGADELDVVREYGGFGAGTVLRISVHQRNGPEDCL